MKTNPQTPDNRTRFQAAYDRNHPRATAHTHGPWHVESGWTISAKRSKRQPDAPFIVAKVENSFIATDRAALHFSPPVAKANAVLIASAPDMLAALEEINSRLCARGGPTGTELAECRAFAQRALKLAQP